MTGRCGRAGFRCMGSLRTHIDEATYPHQSLLEHGPKAFPPFTRLRSPASLPSVANAVNSRGGSGVGGGVGGLGSPASIERQGSHTKKRKASVAGLDSSPGTIESPGNYESDDGHPNDERRKQPVKRACNECRQQKLKCNVQQDPFMRCARCERLHLECKIENNFKRVGKRSRNAEMEKEIVNLKRHIASLTRNAQSENTTQTGAFGHNNVAMDQYGSHEAVAGLLDLRSGIDSSTGFARSPARQPVHAKVIENVVVPDKRITELFNRFFTFFHPFCPFLSPEKTPEHYYSMSDLLFWTILNVGARHFETDPDLYTSLCAPLMRLVWRTLSEVPQSHHVVKALALLCTWPCPTSSTTTDPTFMLVGTMMQIALQIGLHRPSHAQDFSKFKIELREADLKDRVRTWAVCNIVTQRAATAYGQPSNTLYDWTLVAKEHSDESFKLPSAILNPLLIEQFNDRVSKYLYTNRDDPVGLGSDHERATYVSFLSSDFQQLEEKLARDKSAVTTLYLRAAKLHLHIAAFFSPPEEPSYQSDVLKLYHSTTSFLGACLELRKPAGSMMTTGNTSLLNNLTIANAPTYLFNIMLAAGFSLLKLHKSFLGTHGLDSEGAKEMFKETIYALRSMSVGENDLAGRLTEVLVQVWHSGRVRADTDEDRIGIDDIDDSLRLKVRCRMSMSLVYDSVWRWRNHFQLKGKPLESYMQNPTDPAVTVNNSSASSMANGDSKNTTLGADQSLAPAMMPGIAGIADAPAYNGYGTGYGEANYEVFDPLNWMLDGLVDFPYSFTAMQGLEHQQGLGMGAAQL